MDLSEFAPFGGLHALTLLVCAALCVGALGWARRVAGDAHRMRRLRIGWTGFVVVFQLGVTTWWLLPARFDPQADVPIHLCDLSALCIPFALGLRLRLARALLYFWGLVFAPFAYLLPALREGPAGPEFWLFWIAHLQILLSALALPVVEGYRPAWPDLRAAAAGLLLYSAIVAVVDWRQDWNYGFLGPASPPTEFLGPWPARALALVALELLGLFVLWRARPASVEHEAARHGEDRPT